MQQGAEIRPCVELEKVGNHRQGEEGGEPGDAQQRLALCSPSSRGCECQGGIVVVSGKVSSILPLFSRQDMEPVTKDGLFQGYIP